jgi:hypothetical protein
MDGWEEPSRPPVCRSSLRRSDCRGALHFLNVPHINNRPLKTSLSYAKYEN